MTVPERRKLIARYKAGYRIIVAALRGIRATELDWRPAPGEWSAREVVHHLADSETTAGIRLRRLLVEDNPEIQGYDEAEFARRLRYQKRPMAPALRAFEAARATTAQVIDDMSDADWKRAGTHSEIGVYGAERWLELYGEHAEIHAAQIRTNRTLWAASRRGVGRRPATRRRQ